MTVCRITYPRTRELTGWRLPTETIKRTIFADHLKILTDRQDELLQQLAGLTKDGFSKAQEEWEKSVVAWGASLLSFLSNLLSFLSFIPLSILVYYSRLLYTTFRYSTPQGKSKNETEAGAASASTSMKVIVWQLVMLSNECCRLENEKNELDGSNALVSERGSRKILYQKCMVEFCDKHSELPKEEIRERDDGARELS
ncbi:hypothetical protein DFJ58DRAFT_733637 [Suillus subalutaceus]|uniref:uncharacterized protein n=1 Tax=Suillus subalutaceus TaxID=48586 RepID=UPI001B865ED5|nr:uncharacterized protein DFJ58DRAFT_733637 [Suillus subalutaceus]KAG1838814.1 hypothetical protein DFJ58DRAFT_733637 [Suillus subalutaceus]